MLFFAQGYKPTITGQNYHKIFFFFYACTFTIQDVWSRRKQEEKHRLLSVGA